MVYEGARSITGPFLGSLGASALLVAVVSGAGEAAALLLRLVSGPLADRTGRYWSLTLLGYALTAVCVPLLALAPALGSAGLALAVVLVLAERTGKAVRSPAKSVLLARAATGTGLGRGFAVQQALDQVGAFAGPLVVAAVVAAAGTTAPAFAVLAVPGAASILLLLLLRRRAPEPALEPASEVPGRAAPQPVRPTWRDRLGLDLPREFFVFAAAAAAATAGLLTFGVLSFHATANGTLSLAQAPLLYAAAMAAAAVAALATGFAFDRWHGRVLLALPLLGTGAAVLALSPDVVALVAGALLWGAAGGVQDSTVKALVASLVPGNRRGSAYGVFAAIQGAAALLGGAAVGVLLEVSTTAVVVLLVVLQVVSFALLLRTTRT
ncbi:MFS transporter [Kineococcus rhizosphaerae]